MGFSAVQAVRQVFDKVTGYGPNMTEAQWLRRMLFLETVAGKPMEQAFGLWATSTLEAGARAGSNRMGGRRPDRSEFAYEGAASGE